MLWSGPVVPLGPWVNKSFAQGVVGDMIHHHVWLRKLHPEGMLTVQRERSLGREKRRACARERIMGERNLDGSWTSREFRFPKWPSEFEVAGLSRSYKSKGRTPRKPLRTQSPYAKAHRPQPHPVFLAKTTIELPWRRAPERSLTSSSPSAPSRS